MSIISKWNKLDKQKHVSARKLTRKWMILLISKHSFKTKHCLTLQTSLGGLTCVKKLFRTHQAFQSLEISRFTVNSPSEYFLLPSGAKRKPKSNEILDKKTFVQDWIFLNFIILFLNCFKLISLSGVFPFESATVSVKNISNKYRLLILPIAEFTFAE